MRTKRAIVIIRRIWNSLFLTRYDPHDSSPSNIHFNILQLRQYIEETQIDKM